MNLASPKEDVYGKSVEALKGELPRTGESGISFVVTHLGSHLGYEKRKGFGGLWRRLMTLFLWWRTMWFFSWRRRRVGVCFDTCHAFAAGYDLISRGAVEHMLRRFDEVIGLEEFRLVHLNDSKGGIGSMIDRHEHIGMGKIGERGFRNILHSRLGQLRLILETPVDERRSDVENLRKVRELAQ